MQRSGKTFFYVCAVCLPLSLDVAYAATEPDERGQLGAPEAQGTPILWDRMEAEDLPKTPLQVDGSAASATPSFSPSPSPSSAPFPEPSISAPSGSTGTTGER